MLHVVKLMMKKLIVSSLTLKTMATGGQYIYILTLFPRRFGASVTQEIVKT